MNLRERDNTLEELLDAPVADQRLLAHNLRVIRRINVMPGWTSLAPKQVALTVARQLLHTFSLLDVATGAADIPKAMAHRAERQHLQGTIVATDISEQVLEAARANCASLPNIRLERQNVLALTSGDQAFDLVLCSLALLHFSPDDAPTLLRELARVVGCAIIAIDLILLLLVGDHASGLATLPGP